MPTLFDALTVGRLELPNRIVMAPMTRGRAEPDGTPTPRMATYYRQRSSAGLIVTEAAAVCPEGVGWVNAPHVFTDRHEEGWRSVTSAVHDAGGCVYLQLWHMGRASHPDFQAGGALPVAPSAIALAGKARTARGAKPYVAPRALDADELPGIAAAYADAARRAVAAGFDGVEIHGANGYLIDEFLRDAANQRGDDFGGSIEGRWRFPLMVVDAVVAAVGAERTGLRLSPTGSFNGMGDSDPVASFSWGAAELSRRRLAFLHVIEAFPGHFMHTPGAPPVACHIRDAFDGPLILNGGYDRERADAALAAGAADAIAFGVPFLANPDLPARLRAGAPLNAPDPRSFYGGDEVGYTDYPSLVEPSA